MPIIAGGGFAQPSQWGVGSDGSLTVTISDADGALILQRGSVAGATAPSETSRFFAEETALWSKVIKEAGIEPQ